MYNNYIFDLYGTLLDIHTNETSPYLWDKMAQLYSAHGAHYKKTELKKCYELFCEDEKKQLIPPQNEIDLLLVFEKLFLTKQCVVSSDTILSIAYAFRTLSRKYLNVYPGIIDLLNSLKQKEKKIYLLSNAQSCFTLPELHISGLYPYFNGIAISSDIKICKPNVAFMDHLLKTYALNKKDSIMIGNDKFCDITIANASDMDSLYIHSNLSPENTDTIRATYEIADGRFDKVKSIIL